MATHDGLSLFADGVVAAAFDLGLDVTSKSGELTLSNHYDQELRERKCHRRLPFLSLFSCSGVMYFSENCSFTPAGTTSYPGLRARMDR